jgi:hypothetical protein
MPVAHDCRNKNLGDGIDYAQQQYDCLGELISDTLALLEQRGGEDAFINIKYMVRELRPSAVTPSSPCNSDALHTAVAAWGTSSVLHDSKQQLQ